MKGLLVTHPLLRRQPYHCMHAGYGPGTRSLKYIVIAKRIEGGNEGQTAAK